MAGKAGGSDSLTAMASSVIGQDAGAVLAQIQSLSSTLNNLQSLTDALSGKAELTPEKLQQFSGTAEQILPAEIRMFSGCSDAQTSADVSNTAAFSLPADCGPGGAGGACTNAMIASLNNKPDPTWIALLQDMRGILKEKCFTQVPQLSSSRDVDLNSRFQLKQDGGRTKALFVGINYVGQQGELRGCHNDVAIMKEMVLKQGYDESEMKVLMDDGKSEGPTRTNIANALQWLVEGAKAGDSLFFHYSGHGGQVKDDNGDEADGLDETLIPVDYQSAGQIRDDELYTRLCSTLPKGCVLTVLLDCCHSGTALDLPYQFTCSQAGLDQVLSGAMSQLPLNTNFNWEMAIKIGLKMLEAFQKGGDTKSVLGAGMSALLEAKK